MNFKNLLIEEKNNVQLLTVNRPDKLNALNFEVLNELENYFDNIDKKIRCIIITGAGEKAFVAGADIKELNTLTVIEGKKFAERGQSIFNKIENSNVPVIAAINGYALGGGGELAMACHIRLASTTAKFGQPEINLGTIPGYGGTQRLSRYINKSTAMELLLTGDNFSAEDALRLGLISKIYSKEELLSKAWELAEKIAKKPFEAIKAIISLVNASDNITLKEGLNLEAASFGICCGTNNFKEGTSAFLEKRAPNFSNE